jgi:putative hemolysin
MPTWALWLTCVGLLVVRALLGAAEAALYGTSDLRVKELSVDQPSRGRRVERLRTERESTAAALRMGMVLSGFLAAGLGALAPPRMLHFHYDDTDSVWVFLVAPLSSVLLVGVLGASLDVMARGIASAAPERWAFRLSGVLLLLARLLAPVMRLLLALLNLFARPFGGRLRFESPPPPLEELEKLLAAQAAKHTVDQSAPALIRSIFELSDKRCRDVMVPRTEVIGVDISTPPPELLRLLAEESHSRIPVFKDDIDHVVGILHSRELIPLLQHPELIVLADVIRPAHFVPWMKPIGDLLREMQAHKIHMAMVVDEYGGFMGVITLEDILREIVGDIGDEFDIEETHVEKLADGSYMVDAGTEVAEFSQAFGFSLPEGEYETLGGFLSSLAGSIPEVGERFTFNGWHFIVHAKEGARLTRVKMTRARGVSKDIPAVPAPKAEGSSGGSEEAPAQGPSKASGRARGSV